MGDVADILGGGTPKTTTPEYWNGNIDWYSPIEIGKNSYMIHSQKKITKLGLEKSSAHMLPIGTVLFTSRAGIGNTAILSNPGTTNQGFQSIVPHKNTLDTYFIFSRTNELKKYGEINGAGSTFTEISGKQLSKMLLNIPSMSEQSIIGTLIKKIDFLTALQQDQLRLYKKLKQGIIQKLFPSNKKSVPTMRFINFFDNWKQSNLNMIVKISAGGDVNKNKLKKSGKYPVIANALTNDGIIGYYDDFFKIKSPAVTVTGRGDVGHAKARKANFTPVVRLLAVESKHNVYFLENLINNHRILIESTGVPQLTVPQLGKYKVYFPSLKEEKLIGSLLVKIDDLINLQHEQLEKSNTVKKYLLQKLFI